ncbi:MAG: hypothetical protein ACJ79A_11855 [Gemmatimonadaceae bacterium]
MYGLRAGMCVLVLGLLGRPSASVVPRDAIRFDCDSLVATQKSDPLRYRQRGDRCEGVYGQNVSGSSTLRVASLVESLEAFDDSSSLPLRVEWTPPPGEAVLLRASAIRAGLYYRMETVRPIAASSFAWPSDVRRPLRISSADVGVTGVASMSIGGSQREVLVPLRISQRRPAVRSSSYRLTLWPTVGLSEVYLTVAATGADGAPTRYLQRDEKLGYGVYPAERPIVVRLPTLKERGMYLVRVAATREGSGGVTRSILLYHPGAPRPTAP